jgi:predicted O-methyltransferase YrrM
MLISLEQGQFMALLVKMPGVKRAIEVSVFTGYSALSVALVTRAVGYLLPCDINAEFTDIGKPYWAQAGVTSHNNLRIAPAS